MLISAKRIPFIILGAVLVAAGVGTGLALAGSGPGSASSAPATSSSSTAEQGADLTAPTWMTSYSGYSTMMGRYGGGSGMMGGSGGMMYGGTDMGRIMGRVLAAAPQTRISAAQADAWASTVPAGAHIDAATDTVAFTSHEITLTVVTGPSDLAMYRFEIAGLIDPTVVVPSGAHVALRLVNADEDMAHGIVVTESDQAAATGWMPMMSAAPAFSGAEVWALGEETAVGAPTAITDFTATTPGTYTYLCPVPGHAQQGMYGTLTVR
jgi:rusticyanin